MIWLTIVHWYLVIPKSSSDKHNESSVLSFFTSSFFSFLSFFIIFAYVKFLYESTCFNLASIVESTRGNGTTIQLCCIYEYYATSSESNTVRVVTAKCS